MIPDIQTLLGIRAVLNIILFIIVLIGSVGCFIDKKHNGIYKALGATGLMAACYIGVVIFISFIDVLQLPGVRQAMLVTWNVATALLLVAILWLGWEMIRTDE